MSWYCDVERELAHIRGAIGLLKQTRDYFVNETPVSDPAYWRIRLSNVRQQFDRDKALERQLNELLADLAGFSGEEVHRERSDALA
ncbi:protein of unknown function [Paraburkholderia kururiensis]|uniref:hypothetical protein n=1 Tax=Paraburkholderia kururiensis TaxID=984307 RepID=UPI0039A4E0A7